jgi:hypothetical protein
VILKTLVMRVLKSEFTLRSVQTIVCSKIDVAVVGRPHGIQLASGLDIDRRRVRSVEFSVDGCRPTARVD